MPQVLESCVAQVMGKGHDEKSAWSICRRAMGMTEKNGGDLMEYAMDICDKEKTMKKEYGDLQSINGVEIFAAGEWNGDKYTEEDLDMLVQAFNETKTITKPYLKLGHGNAQKLLADDELPAAGFVNSIYRNGKKILADFINIPQKIYELIQKKAYSKVSSEIFVDFKSNGKTYPFALKAVSLLGGATPAVHTLNDILSLYSVGEMPTIELSAQTIKAYEFKASDMSGVNKEEKENQMTLEEAMRQVAKLESEVKSFQEENQALEKDLKLADENLKATQAQAKEFKEKSDGLQAEIQKIKKESFDKEIDAEVKAFQVEGKIVPAQAPILIALLKNVRMNEETKEFSVGEKKYADVKSLVKAFIDAHVDINAEGDGKSGHAGTASDEDGFVEKVNKYAKEKGISVKQATLELSKSN